MAKHLHDWSATDASNNFATPDGAPEGWLVGSMNNVVRALMGVIRRFLGDTDGSVSTAGTTTAYTVALNQVNISAWYDGLTFRVMFNQACGATPTISPTPSGGSALVAKTLVHNDGSAIAANDIAANTVADLVYKSGTDKVHILSSLAKPGVVPTLTTRGDLLTVNSTPALARLAVGAANTVLCTDGIDPSWAKVTGAHIAMGSDAQGDILYYNGSNYARLGAGTAGQFLKTQGTSANPAWASTRTLGTADTSINGTAAVAYSSLPAGLNAIDIYFQGLSPTNNVDLLLQIGDSGGLHTTGYASHSENSSGTDATSTAGFIAVLTAAADVAKGKYELRRVTGHTWMATHMVSADDDDVCTGVGIVTLDTDLDRVSLQCSDGANFDAGTFVNISYW